MAKHQWYASIDRETGFIWTSVDKRPIRPFMPLADFLSFPASADCHGQTWDFDPQCITHIYRLPRLKVRNVYFLVTLHFKHELLDSFRMVYSYYQRPLTWVDRLNFFFCSPRTPSDEESLSECAEWLLEDLGQELDSQVYPWGTVTLVDDLSRGPADRFVFIEIKYFEYRSDSDS